MEKNNEKRVLRVELDDEVKKVSITGKDVDEKVVMRQELDEDELDLATGGAGTGGHTPPHCPPVFGKQQRSCIGVG